MFVAGIINKPNLNSVGLKILFLKTMTRNRFESISSFLLFSDSRRYDVNNEVIPSDYFESQIKK
jgi:hypothetical protein